MTSTINHGGATTAPSASQQPVAPKGRGKLYAIIALLIVALVAVGWFALSGRSTSAAPSSPSVSSAPSVAPAAVANPAPVVIPTPTTNPAPVVLAPSSLVPVPAPSQLSPLGYTVDPSPVLDGSKCPVAMPAADTKPQIVLQDGEDIIHADIAMINLALVAHNTDCAVQATGGNFIQFTKFPAVSYQVSNFDANWNNKDVSKADAIYVTFTVTMADHSVRPFTSDKSPGTNFSSILSWNGTRWVISY